MTSKLYVTEFEAPQNAMGGMFPPLAFFSDDAILQAPIDYSGGHAESAAFGTNTRLVRVHTDSICCVIIAKAPVATTSHQRMTAGQTEYFLVKPGDKISAVITT
jgi:hypothetical protein